MFVLCSEFHDEGQDAVIGCGVGRVFPAFHGEAVRVFELYEHVLADLQVSVFRHAFFVHHAAEVGIPLLHLLHRLFVFQLKAGEILFSNGVGVRVEGTQDVFHLPHVEQVFSQVLLAKFSRNYHEESEFSKDQARECRSVLGGNPV